MSGEGLGFLDAGGCVREGRGRGRGGGLCPGPEGRGKGPGGGLCPGLTCLFPACKVLQNTL